MYERSSPEDGDSLSRKTAKLIKAGWEFLDFAYAGLDSPDLARMSIALRAADYGDSLPTMLNALDEAFGVNPHYLGWARHSYNDTLGIVYFLVNALMLKLASEFVPGFRVNGCLPAVVGSILLSAVDYVLTRGRVSISPNDDGLDAAGRTIRCRFPVPLLSRNPTARREHPANNS